MARTRERTGAPRRFPEPVRGFDPYGPEAMALPDFGPSIYEGTPARAPTAAPDVLAQALMSGNAGQIAGETGQAAKQGFGVLGRFTGSVAPEGANPVVQEALRPANYIPIGAGTLPLRLARGAAGGIGARLAGEAVGRALPEDTNPVLRGVAQIGAGLIGGGVGIAAPSRAARKVGLGGARAGGEVFVPADTASGRLFGISEPKQGLSRADEALNALKRTSGIGVPEQDIATPIMRERQRVRSVAESQAARLAAISDDVAMAFKVDKTGRVKDLPGNPTIQDIAARLPQYEKSLNVRQGAVLARLRDEVAPFDEVLREQGVEHGARADVQPGGFYLPRGRAALEGADAPLKVGLRRGGVGGKKGFERHAEFDSMAQGIDAGYRYASFRDAVQSYAHDAANRAVDAWASESFKATGLAEGVKERLVRQRPQLVREWEDVNKGIASVRGRLATAESRAGVNVTKADELDTALAGMQRAQPEGGAAPLARIPAMMEQQGEIAGGLTVPPIRGVAHPGTPAQYGLTGPVRPFSEGKHAGMEQVLGKLDQLVPDGTERIRFLDTAVARTERRLDVLATRGGTYRQTAEGLRDELASLKEHLDNITPEYRRAHDKAMLTPRDQGAIGLSGLSGTTFPDEVANVANKYLAAERPPSGVGSGALTATSAFNGLLRGIRATADISFTGIQGLLGAVMHPVQYARAMKVAFQSMGDKAAFGKYVVQFDDIARSAGRPDSAAWNAVGSRLGGTSTEFQIGQGLRRTGAAIQNAPVIKQANRAFGVFGDTLRLGSNDALYSARQAAGKPVGLAEMADIAKFSNLMTGWSSRRFLGDTGAILEFAPRFFQSQLDLVGNALTDKGIVGNEARAALAKLVGIGSLITFAANAARGHNTDVRLGSPNFMRIRDVGGADVSLFGPWDSLLRGTAAATKGDFEYITRSKASPLVALAWDEISGKSFIGQDTRNIEYLLRSLLPFSVAQIGTPGETPVSAAIGLTGVKATPLSPTDQADLGRYPNLPADQQFRAIRHISWLSVKDMYGPDTEGFDSYYDWYREQTKEYEGQFSQLGPAGAAQAAAKLLATHPLVKAYTDIHNKVEDQWAIDHPQEALRLLEKESSLSWQDKTFRPSKKVLDSLLALGER